MTAPVDLSKEALDALDDEIKDGKSLEIPYARTWNTLKRCERTITALRARIAALERDALRYRWLRDGAECHVIFSEPAYEDRYAHVESLLALEDLDAAIDTAIDTARDAMKEGK